MTSNTAADYFVVVNFPNVDLIGPFDSEDEATEWASTGLDFETWQVLSPAHPDNIFEGAVTIEDSDDRGEEWATDAERDAGTMQAHAEP